MTRSGGIENSCNQVKTLRRNLKMNSSEKRRADRKNISSWLGATVIISLINYLQKEVYIKINHEFLNCSFTLIMKQLQQMQRDTSIRIWNNAQHAMGKDLFKWHTKSLIIIYCESCDPWPKLAAFTCLGNVGVCFLCCCHV